MPSFFATAMRSSHYLCVYSDGSTGVVVEPPCRRSGQDASRRAPCRWRGPSTRRRSAALDARHRPSARWRSWPGTSRGPASGGRPRSPRRRARRSAGVRRPRVLRSTACGSHMCGLVSSELEQISHGAGSEPRLWHLKVMSSSLTSCDLDLVERERVAPERLPSKLGAEERSTR